MRTRLLAFLAVSSVGFSQDYKSRGTHIESGQSLLVNEYLQDPTRTYYLIGQGDGNFVVYRGTPPPQGTLDGSVPYTWASGTGAHPPGRFPNAKLSLRSDGLLSSENSGRTLCASTNHLGVGAGRFYLSVNETGNIEVYEGTYPDRSTRIWYGSRGRQGSGVATVFRWEITIRNQIHSSVFVEAVSAPEARRIAGQKQPPSVTFDQPRRLNKVGERPIDRCQ